MVQLPETLAVGAGYGLAVMSGVSPNAWRFAMYILSADGQNALARHGFAVPSLQKE
jgi:molybdate transport system substrate-binding protein